MHNSTSVRSPRGGEWRCKSRDQIMCTAAPQSGHLGVESGDIRAGIIVAPQLGHLGMESGDVRAGITAAPQPDH